MSDKDLGWIAGILEGEGYIGIARSNRERRDCAVQVRVCMTDEDVVRRCQTITGLGTVKLQKPSASWNQPHHKPIWRWYVGRSRDVADLLTAVYPLMGERRKARIEQCLVVASTIGIPFGERTHCPQGHPYEGDNLVTDGKGRKCRTCLRAHKRAAYARSLTSSRSTVF